MVREKTMLPTVVIHCALEFKGYEGTDSCACRVQEVFRGETHAEGKEMKSTAGLA